MKTARLTLAAMATFFVADMAHSTPLTFTARSRSLSATGGGEYKPVETEVTWEASKIAIVIVDMWDDHWCPNAAKRVALNPQFARPSLRTVEPEIAWPSARMWLCSSTRSAREATTEVSSSTLT